MMPAVVSGRVAVNCVAAACEAVVWQGDTWGTGCFLFLPDRVAADAIACGTSFGLGIPAVIDPGGSFLCIGASGAIGERGKQGAHRLRPDLAGPLPCCPGALTPQLLTNTAALTQRSPS
ncbi:hypothetical protein NDU88_003868 [Pleurodeles waltl]|uniref:Uncharacterized protein n=1 Tax=Pleurodeles waltl TaxID=8319 RepID=A0AAV7RF55_PLEWA|nr:hypothetical protein NDU88_003868 [Pleurodeles waltl]